MELHTPSLFSERLNHSNLHFSATTVLSSFFPVLVKNWSCHCSHSSHSSYNRSIAQFLHLIYNESLHMLNERLDLLESISVHSRWEQQAAHSSLRLVWQVDKIVTCGLGTVSFSKVIMVTACHTAVHSRQLLQETANLSSLAHLFTRFSLWLLDFNDAVFSKHHHVQIF